MPNDEICIANHKFRVHLGPDEAPPPKRELPRPSEHTQQLDARDVADLLKQAKNPRPEEEDDGLGPVRPNSLPDVYPDEAPPK